MNSKTLQKKQHKGGRPRVDEPRIHRVYTKLTRSERDLINARVRGSGMSRSEAIRLLLLHDNIPDFYYRGLNPFAAAAFKNLQPLQSNLNQIAHQLNGYSRKRIELNDDALSEIVVHTLKHTRAVEQLVKHLRHQFLTDGDSRVIT